jgi:hypothetical protein
MRDFQTHLHLEMMELKRWLDIKSFFFDTSETKRLAQFKWLGKRIIACLIFQSYQAKINTSQKQRRLLLELSFSVH